MEKNKEVENQLHDATSLTLPSYGIEKTQQEIAAHPDITVKQRAISEISKKFDTEQIANHFYISHKEVDKIAEMFDIDEQTAWAILLGGPC